MALHPRSLAWHWSLFKSWHQGAHNSPPKVLPCLLSRVQLCATLWTVARQAPLSVGFSRQEGCHTLLQGNLPDSGIKPESLVPPALEGRFFTTSATWEAQGPLILMQKLHLRSLSLPCFWPPSYLSPQASMQLATLLVRQVVYSTELGWTGSCIHFLQ